MVVVVFCLEGGGGGGGVEVWGEIFNKNSDSSFYQIINIYLIISLSKQCIDPLGVFFSYFMEICIFNYLFASVRGSTVK